MSTVAGRLVDQPVAEAMDADSRQAEREAEEEQR
jgi:hypothetical protein